MTSKWKTVCIQKILFQVYKVKGKAWREMIAKLRYRTFNLTSACNCISEFISCSDLLLETTVVSIDQSWCKPSGFIYLFFFMDRVSKDLVELLLLLISYWRWFFFLTFFPFISSLKNVFLQKSQLILFEVDLIIDS